MKTEGLYTMVWGSDQWNSMHNITFNYPYSPTIEDKDNYYKYFISLGEVLPCCTCRKHYNFHIRNGETELNQAALASRDTLTLWLYNFHKEVSHRLGYDYDITYDMLKKKYNSYIAKCEMTNEQKQISYKNMYDVHACVVRKDIILCFVDYAESRGLNKDKFIENVNYYSSLDRESEEWFNRNQLCQELIKKMRINGIYSIEQTDKFEGLPTIDELKLMELTSTTLSTSSIKKTLKKFGCKVRKIYKWQT
jgi:hypothetical protein